MKHPHRDSHVVMQASEMRARKADLIKSELDSELTDANNKIQKLEARYYYLVSIDALHANCRRGT